MTATHRLHIAARCPVDNRLDVYELTVETDRVIKVEDILAAADRCGAAPVFQEDLTDRLALALGCRVTTVGLHSAVRTTVVSGDPKDPYERGRR